MSQPDPTPRRRWTAGAVALLAIGLLFLVPSGLCTAAMGGFTLFALFASPAQSSESLSILLEALMVGGPFIAIGAGLIWLARRLRATGSD